MTMMPKKTKYRKMHKGRIKGNVSVGASLVYGDYGLKALEPERVTARQIEAARRVLAKQTNRARVWIRIFPDRPVSAKPAEVRMGKGKGAVEFWVAQVHPGRVLFEIEGIDRAVALIALKKAASKLPIKTKIISRVVEE